MIAIAEGIGQRLRMLIDYDRARSAAQGGERPSS